MNRTIYLIDDHDGFRQSAQWWLSGIGYTVHAHADPREALDALCARDPRVAACVLLDVRMPQMSGLELHDALRARGAAPPVIYMTGHGDVPLAVRAMQKGAVSFLEKPFDDAALEAALTAAFALAESASAASPAPAPATPAPGADAAGSAPPADDADPARRAYAHCLGRLTPREREVLGLLVQGKTNKLMARELVLSPKTIELHRSRIMAKFGTKNLVHLVHMVHAQRADWTPPGPGANRTIAS